MLVQVREVGGTGMTPCLCLSLASNLLLALNYSHALPLPPPCPHPGPGIPGQAPSHHSAASRLAYVLLPSSAPLREAAFQNLAALLPKQ